MDKRSSVLTLAAVTLILLLPEVHGQIMPTGCTYGSGMFECDYSSLLGSGGIPLQASLFDPIPQRLRLTNLPSSLSSAIFDSDFASLAPADYDENYPATLELKCTNSSQTTTVASPFLEYMGHIQDFRIINCALGSVPAGAFAELGNLDRFSIENGSISAVDTNMLAGVYISRNMSAYPKYPIHRGEFSIRHTKLSGSLPAGLFSNQAELRTVVLDGMDLTSISYTQFSSNTILRFLSLGWNDLVEIPSGLFDGLDSLTEVRLYDTTVDCTCDDLWFVTYTKNNYISLYGDVLCRSGSHADKLALQYHKEVCLDVETAECDGLELANTCMSSLNVALSVVSLIAFILSWVVLGLTISIKDQINPSSKSGSGSRNKKRPPLARRKGPNAAKKGWD